MIWDQPEAFILDIEVRAEHIDELGHANNAVYVTWLEQCAWQHSQSLGLGLPDYRRLDRAMAVLRHEIDYLASAFAGERLQLATWITDSDQRLKMKRSFQLIRPADQQTLLRAQTTSSASNSPAASPSECPTNSSQAMARR